MARPWSSRAASLSDLFFAPSFAVASALWRRASPKRPVQVVLARVNRADERGVHAADLVDAQAGQRLAVATWPRASAISLSSSLCRKSPITSECSIHTWALPSQLFGLLSGYVGACSQLVRAILLDGMVMLRVSRMQAVNYRLVVNNLSTRLSAGSYVE